MEFGQGRYDLAWSQKSGPGSSGYSRLATVNFIVSADIIMGRSVPETPFPTQVNGVYLIDAAGDTLDFDLPGGDQTLANNEALSGPAGKLEVFPNPTTGKVYLQLPQGSHGTTLEVLDAQGRLVWASPAVPELPYVDLSHLGAGLFLLRARLDVPTATAVQNQKTKRRRKKKSRKIAKLQYAPFGISPEGALRF